MILGDWHDLFCSYLRLLLRRGCCCCYRDDAEQCDSLEALVGFGPVVAVTYNNNKGEMRNQKSKCQCDVVSDVAVGHGHGHTKKKDQMAHQPLIR